MEKKIISGVDENRKGYFAVGLVPKGSTGWRSASVINFYFNECTEPEDPINLKLLSESRTYEEFEGKLFDHVKELLRLLPIAKEFFEKEREW